MIPQAQIFFLFFCETLAYEKFRAKVKIYKRNDILDWLVRYWLPDDLKAIIMNSLNENNLVEQIMDADVDMDFMFAILPADIKSSIKRHISMNALKKYVLRPLYNALLSWGNDLN